MVSAAFIFLLLAMTEKEEDEKVIDLSKTRRLVLASGANNHGYTHRGEWHRFD